ncbi:hypothetical membrane protein [Pseudomonas knackmussii B13]|uniref:Hypothetical membrane protein n=1 Tax=Pseudomonas knackmussii (strain DSM 6978 / CCUG 54928 / LMG 23759 / B13) TaxID=1301098 RepID=A0A024HFX8_PSEKB|nr:hypothetical protein [Pseudomonas knackmussii]CDF83935.1 hypothetical membrane protein [Pseudomonas knackmussii B13]
MGTALPLSSIRPLFFLGGLALLLCGCAWGPSANVRTLPPECHLPPAQAVKGTDLQILQAAFRHARQGVLLTSEPAATDSPSTLGVSLPSASDRQALYRESLDHGQIQAFSKLLEQSATLLNTPQGQNKVPGSVREELASRIPWLARQEEPLLSVQDPANDSANNQAVADGLSLIGFVQAKNDSLLKVNIKSQITPFHASDLKALQPSMQRLSTLAPFHQLTLLTAERIARHLETQHEETPELLGMVAIFNTANFISTYFDEYFRGGQWLQVSVDQPAFEDAVVKRVNEQLKTPLSADQQQALKDTLKAHCNQTAGLCSGLPTLGQSGFVSIFGQNLQFAGVNLVFGDEKSAKFWKPTLSSPSVGVLGPQLAQVMVEAVFDANGQHPPGLAGKSTACVKGLFDERDQPGQCITTPGKDWSTLDIRGNRTQAVVTTGTGVLIRGGYIASLNNETVASIIETFAGASARKAVQQIATTCNRPALADVAQNDL